MRHEFPFRQIPTSASAEGGGFLKIIAWQLKPRRSFWFRIFGFGLNIINRDTYPAPFSIRYGHRKEIRIGRWGVHVLYRNQITGIGK